MSLLGQPMPRLVELAGEATRGLERVLEVAAGNGLVTRAIAAGAREVVGADYSGAMTAALEPRVRAAGLTNVLRLVPDLPGALAALRRVLKPGGRVIVPTFCHDETALSLIVSRALAVSGFPGHPRASARSGRRVERVGQSGASCGARERTKRSSQAGEVGWRRATHALSDAVGPVRGV